ncbi:hypothetical protein [Haloferula sp. BvORR071]|uniref:hypothetical protein n=1 Tax=Haloferula sp. BvORR071 TaxID=1396141 RepID=UPI0005550710|nr:hypothetical protein [Haloferula sp. BvORR071]
MDRFCHIFEVHTCPKCRHVHQLVAPAVAGFFAAAAAVASFAIYFRLCFWSEPLPWYYLFSIYAGELLTLWIAGQSASVLMTPFQRIPASCPGCGTHERPFFAGRYFKPSERPHWTDKVILAAFIVANVGLWLLIPG